MQRTENLSDTERSHAWVPLSSPIRMLGRIADFFTVEVWCPRGLDTFYASFAIELATRRFDIVGITPGRNEAWMVQAGRNLTDVVDGFLTGKQFLILDRDAKFSSAFRKPDDLLRRALSSRTAEEESRCTARIRKAARCSINKNTEV